MAAPALVPSPLPRFKNILFPTDFSEESLPVLPYAGQVARTFGARMHLCHIHAEVPLAAGLAAPRLYEAEGKEAAEGLVALRESPDLEGLDLKLVLASGTIEDEMQNIIRDYDIDLIVAGTHGRTGLNKMVFGSAVEEICRVATCPVFTVGPATESVPDAPFKNILFPTNLSEISKKTLPYIALLAGKYGSKVTVLHVLQEGGTAGAGQQKNLESIRASMSIDFGPPLSKFHPEFLVVPGGVAETVLRVARERQAGLITLGIRNAFRPGILVERTAYRIMAGAHCPVLTVP